MTEPNLTIVETRSIGELLAEVYHARRKFPSPDHLLVALMEETGELARACLQHGPRSDEARREALQVAAVALRIYEEGDPSLENLSAEARQP